MSSNTRTAAEHEDSVNNLDFTVATEGPITAVTFTAGPNRGRTFRIDIPRLRRQQAERQRTGREETPEEELPRLSVHAFEQQISEEEGKALTALERWHEVQGTLHLLYPEVYSEGYVLTYDDDDDGDEEEDGGAGSHRQS